MNQNPLLSTRYRFLFVLSLVCVTLTYWLVIHGGYDKVLGISTTHEVLKAPNRPIFKVQPKAWPLTSEPLIDINQIQATSLIVIDEDTGKILAERNSQARRSIASTTKIMTASLVLEFLNPDSDITITKPSINDLPADSALMGISPNEHYTVKELLYGMLLPSGNDAAMALALAVSGSEAKFVDLMNAKALQLGLKDTHFTNPSGLDNTQHYSSARDLAIMAHYARSFPLFSQIVTTPSITLPYSENHKEVYLENYNAFIQTYPGATGIKPGNTGDAGNCLVASATRNGHQLIGVLLDTPGRNTNMAKLFDATFAAE